MLQSCRVSSVLVCLFALAPQVGAQFATARESADLNYFRDFEINPPLLFIPALSGPMELDGDLLAVRLQDSRGDFRVQLFSATEGIWGLEDEVFGPVFGTSSFGSSLSLEGDKLAVGDPSRFGNPRGETRIYRRTAQGQWNEEQILTASDGTSGDAFGFPSFDGNRILIGAGFEDAVAPQAGAAYLFERVAGVWTEVAKMETSVPVPFERMGRSVVLAGDLALLSTRNGARVFRETAGTWTEEAELNISGVPANDVVVDGGTVGLVRESDSRVFLFEQVAGTWTLIADIAPGGAQGPAPNRDIELENGRLLIGTPVHTGSLSPLMIGTWLAERTSSGWPALALPFESRPPIPIIRTEADFVSFVSISGDRVASLLRRRENSLNATRGTVLIHDLAETPSTEFCFGSQSSTGCGVCPCGNTSPVADFGGCLSSNGTAPQLYCGGLPRLTNDTLRFDLHHATPNSFALLLSGASQLPAQGPCPQGSGIAGTPALEGLRCVGMNLIRHGTLSILGTGNLHLSWGDGDANTGPGLTTQAYTSPGQTRHWQAFFREPMQSGCGTGIGTSQAISVTSAL